MKREDREQGAVGCSDELFSAYWNTGSSRSVTNSQSCDEKEQEGEMGRGSGCILTLKKRK